MTKTVFVYLVLIITAYVIVAEAKHLSQSTKSSALVSPTPSAGATTNDVDNLESRKALAESILNMVLSKICGRRKTFDLRKKRCQYINKVFVHAFGNPGLGK
ncbi:uncharacterized protein [Argopecten irradians]|uniref:uncharacterized protein n=1 Tax=Argopecten irradians TaxID=31199 RepID=UPI00371E6A44